MKQLVGLGLILLLAGCGGGTAPRGDGAVSRTKPMAVGPISTACMQSDRRARSRELCGCIQAVANRTLSGAEQRRAVRFYRDPHSAQEVRQSKRPADQQFWRAYRAYGEQAERTCG